MCNSKVLATTFYIATTGSDSAGDGSQANPWASLYHALPLLSAGDILMQEPGLYSEYTHGITTANNGTPIAPITIMGMPGSVNQGSGIYIANNNYIVDNITISNFAFSSKMLGGVVVGARANNLIVRNCKFLNFLIDQSQYGVVWYPDPAYIGPYTNCTFSSCAANCLVSNNLFNNFMGAECIRVGGSNNIICNNKILNQMNGDIFQFFGCSNVIRGNYISNAFYRLDVGGGQHADMFQTYAQDGNLPVSPGDPYFESFGNLAEDNQFWDCQISFGQMTADVYGPNGFVAKVEDFTERNNLFVRCGGQDGYAGGSGGSICSIGIPKFRAINNTYIDCYKDTLAGGYIIDISFHTWTNNLGAHLGLSTNDVIINNAFIDCGYNTNIAFIGIESGYGFNTNNWNLTLKSNYCSWWTGSSWTRVNPGWQVNIKGVYYDNDTYDPPPDINNGDDPKLVWWSTSIGAAHHCRPLYGSPLIDAGMNMLANDIEGTLRPLGAAADIGCFEFDPNLVMHFDFDENPIASNKVCDVTGYGHNAVQMDPTNFCKTTASADGTVASLGTVVAQIPDNNYNYTWYGAITNLGGAQPVLFITNGTFSAWVQMATNGERWDTILDTGCDPAGEVTPSLATNSWNIGYGHSVKIGGSFPDQDLCTNFIFKIYGNTVTNGLNSPFLEAGWPGPMRDGQTWALLTATWQGNGNLILYYNGQPWSTNALGVPWLRVSTSPVTPWVALNIATHGGTPQWGDDIWPNYGSLKGKLDDVRLYNRALAAAEVANLYVDAVSGSVSGSSSYVARPQPPQNFHIVVAGP